MQVWTDREAYFSFAWFICWVMIGTFSLWAHNLVLPYMYIMYAMAVYLGQLYFCCTRCAYFGKKCYLLGGIAAPTIFAEREKKPIEPDDSLSAAFWFILGIFPALFLLYYQDWILFVVYSALAYGWFAYKKYDVGKKCGDNWCPSK